MARPTKYTKSTCQVARLCAMSGMTDIETAKELGITKSTLYKWKLEYTEFSDSLKVGKEIPDDRAEATLYQKAMGWVEDDVKIFQYQGNPIVVPYKRIVDPDTTSLIFWLKNRRPNTWRDRHELTGADGEGLEFTVNIKNAGEGEK